MSDFTYQPQYGAQVKKAPRVLLASFGDGYEQRLSDGLNPIKDSWNLTFKDTNANIDAINSFLTTKNAVESFTWTPSGYSEIRVVCREWSVTVDTPTTSSLMATFEQVFE